MPQVFAKDIKNIKCGMKVEVCFDPTTVIAVAVSKDDSKNRKVKVPCDGCVPLTGYAYSTANDSYTVRCVEYIFLGSVRLSYKVKMRGAGGWQVKVPLPPDVVRRYLDLEQRSMLKVFEKKYEGVENLDIEFVQMVNAF